MFHTCNTGVYPTCITSIEVYMIHNACVHPTHVLHNACVYPTHVLHNACVYPTHVLHV